jgi:hypothetical protein
MIADDHLLGHVAVVSHDDSSSRFGGAAGTVNLTATDVAMRRLRSPGLGHYRLPGLSCQMLVDAPQQRAWPSVRHVAVPDQRKLTFGPALRSAPRAVALNTPLRNS